MTDDAPIIGGATTLGGSNATLIKVRVEKTGHTGSEYHCDILADDRSSEPYVKNNDIVLPQDEGPFRIKFRLVNLDWDTDDPFNTDRNGCPGKKSNDNEQIFVQPPTGRDIEILDLNDRAACKIHYRMNFTGGAYCDPIINNGGKS